MSRFGLTRDLEDWGIAPDGRREMREIREPAWA